jgi:threonine dehydrogenase-like Zn-dependent dehydrogenase
VLGCLDARSRTRDAIDCVRERLELAEHFGKAETLNFEEENVFDARMVMTRGLGPECCIDAVGCEAHVGPTIDSYVDKAKEMIHLQTGRAHVLREAI